MGRKGTKVKQKEKKQQHVYLSPISILLNINGLKTPNEKATIIRLY